jgi:hypothetical protein
MLALTLFHFLNRIKPPWMVSKEKMVGGFRKFNDLASKLQRCKGSPGTPWGSAKGG